MPALMPLLSYDDPSTQGQHERRLSISESGLSDGASLVTAFDQRPTAQVSPASRTSSSGEQEISSVGQNFHHLNKMKARKASKRKSHRERPLGEAQRFTNMQTDYKLKDLTNIVKDDAVGQDEYTVKAVSFSDSVKALKKAVYNVQMALYEGVQSKSQLQAASAILTESEYADVITERSIARLCGFPLCKQPLHEDGAHQGHYRISLREHKVYDIQESKLFCSTDCLIESKIFLTTLQSDRDGVIEPEKLSQVIAAVRCLTLNSDKPVDPPLGRAESSLKVLENNHFSFEEFKVVGPSSSIEGYVPQVLQGRDLSICKVDSVSSLSENKNNINRNTNASYTKSGCHSKLLQERSVDFCEEQDTGYRSLESDKPTMELKSALCGTHKKRGVRVSWADQCNMEPILRANELVVDDEDTTSKIEDQRLLSSKKLATARSELAPCLEDESSLNMGCEVGNLNAIHQAAEPDPDLVTSTQKIWESAEALACALSKASAASESGELEASEAASKFGISFSSGYENEMKPQSSRMDGSVENLEVTGISKPECSKENLQCADSRSAWYDGPPKGYKLELSMFGTIWIALEEWISTSTVMHIYGREEEGQDSFLSFGGREYKHQTFLEDRVSAEISRTLSSCIARVLPDIVQALRLSIPVSVMEQALGRLVRSMSFVEALPPLNMKQWRVIVALFLDALSVHRLPTLAVQFGNNRALLRKVVVSAGLSDAEYETFKDLLLPLGRLPSFATSCGG